MAAFMLFAAEWGSVIALCAALALGISSHPAWFAVAVIAVAVGLWARGLATSNQRHRLFRRWLADLEERSGSQRAASEIGGRRR